MSKSLTYVSAQTKKITMVHTVYSEKIQVFVIFILDCIS